MHTRKELERKAAKHIKDKRMHWLRVSNGLVECTLTGWTVEPARFLADTIWPRMRMKGKARHV